MLEARPLRIDSLAVTPDADPDRLVAQAEGMLQELDAATDEWNEKQLGPSIRRLRENPSVAHHVIRAMLTGNR